MSIWSGKSLSELMAQEQMLLDRRMARTNDRYVQQYYATGSNWVSVSNSSAIRNRHVCLKPLSKDHEEFDQGVLNFYEQSHPELVTKLKKDCNQLSCLLERINQHTK